MLRRHLFASRRIIRSLTMTTILSYSQRVAFKKHQEEDIIESLRNDFQLIRSKSGQSLTDNEIEEKLNELCEWVSTAPKSMVYRINTLKTSSEFIADKFRDFLAKEYPNRKVPQVLTFEKLPELVMINKWDDSVVCDLEPVEKEIIVDVACGVAILRGANVYSPGVIGMPHGIKKGDKVSVYADISRQCKKGWLKKYEGDKVFVANGIMQVAREDLFNGLVRNERGTAIKIIDNVSKIPSFTHEGMPRGLCLLQNLSSIICVRLLNPQPNETILDMCAAPGNKTTHISALMNNEGTLMAVDKAVNKIHGLRVNCETFGATNVHVFHYDSRKSASDEVTGDPVTGGPPFDKNSFDRILLDGPCSGMGQRPQLLNSMTRHKLGSFKILQRRLMAAAVELLKPGGTLVYSTCTLTLSENENIVAGALQKFPCLKLISNEDAIAELGFADYASPGHYVEGLTDEQSHCLTRFAPLSDTIGFFVARFVKE